jgi:hypothetical protein
MADAQAAGVDQTLCDILNAVQAERQPFAVAAAAADDHGLLATLKIWKGQNAASNQLFIEFTHDAQRFRIWFRAHKQEPSTRGRLALFQGGEQVFMMQIARARDTASGTERWIPSVVDGLVADPWMDVVSEMARQLESRRHRLA